MIGQLSGWAAFALVPLAAIAGWVLRRFAPGAIVCRMRPHFVLGYAALLFALVHLWASMRSMGGSNPTGIWLATLALGALGFQTLVGANLQSPGVYRKPLRRWHVSAFVAILLLGGGHVAFNWPATASQFASGVDNRTIVEHPVGLPFGIAQQRLRVVEKAPLAAHPMDRM